MKPFLNQVAQYYAASLEKLRETVFILPNKRSALHLRHAMNAIVNPAPEEGGVPSKKRIGKYISINSFFQEVYGVETTDRIPLLLSLFDCYRQLNDRAESLDEFIHWGRVMLSDFDNVDKYLVDAEKLFVNVDDFRQYQDTFQYLTETQRQAIEQFLAHFRERSGRLTANVEGGNDDMKARFLKVWNLLGPLYKRFNEKLEQDGMAYEGRIYRRLAEAIKDGIDMAELMRSHYPYSKRFVFVGLNALNECEKVLLRAIRDAGMAEFVWDFSSREIRDGRNKASFFLRKNVEEFPQAFPLDTDEPLRRPDVRVVSVPSSVGQTKLAPEILSEVTGEVEDTVFVLPDETLLMPLLSAIPERYDTINITMGYPVDKSAVYSLVKAFIGVQMSLRKQDNKIYYHHKAVSNLFSCSLFRLFIKDSDRAIVDRVKSEAKQYIPLDDLVNNDGWLGVFFTPVVIKDETGGDTLVVDLHVDPLLNLSLASAQQNAVLARRIMNLLQFIGGNLAVITGADDAQTEDIDANMEIEFAQRYHDDVERLAAIPLDVLPGTWLRLLDGLVKPESVPFEGDALKGLQVMGTLETRALDFRNVVILSANEDLFPHRSADNSFIPPELRKGFGMPTLEYQDAVWAYYFYRLIQRAENVWMVYDSRTEGLLSGEESRYIKQLKYHFRYPLEQYTAVAPLSPVTDEEFVEKTEEDIRQLKAERHISASSLQSYLSCPVKFYYQAVKGLKADDEAVESLDAAMLGTVFHACMETLYKDHHTVTQNDIQAMLSDEEALKALVETGICEQMKAPRVEGKNIVIAEVILEYIKGALRHDLRLLRESGSAGFRIIGLERFMKMTIDGFPFIGFVDRIDSYRDGEVRIVDYKTGHVEDDDILITDDNAAGVVDKLFGESNYGRPKIALQLYLYGKFAHEDVLRNGEKVVNSIYSTSKLLTKPLPDVEESEAFTQLVDGKVHETLAEVADTSIPWKRTCDKKVCAMCDFRSICGR